MPRPADRRTFLATSAQAIIGTAACTHFGCRPDDTTDNTAQRTGFDQLIVDLEQRIPKTLRDKPPVSAHQSAMEGGGRQADHSMRDRRASAVEGRSMRCMSTL